MTKQTTQKIKGIAILIMIAHHFLVYDFGINFSYDWVSIGQMLKICVAIYAVLSGYGYFFAKEKTLMHGLKKSWGLLQIYWLMLFTLFVPAALLGGWKLTPGNALVNLFALGPNLNWNAWYVYFFIFCMLVMPVVHKLFGAYLAINVAASVIVSYSIEVLIHVFIPNYQNITISQDLFNCMLYFGVFLVGYLMAKYDVLKKWKVHWAIGVLFMATALLLRLAFQNINTFGFNTDVFYAPLFNIGGSNFFDGLKGRWLNIFSLLGKYSTGMWFFHAAFFSTYICNWFQPLMKIVPWAPLMYLWLVALSLAGAVAYQKILNGILYIPKLIKSYY